MLARVIGRIAHLSASENQRYRPLTMNTTVTTHRILATLIVVLIALLIPFGRALERAMQVLPVVSFYESIGFVLLVVPLGIIFVGRKVGQCSFRPVHKIGLGVIGILAILFLRTSAEWCHFVVYGLLAIALAGSGLHPARSRFPLFAGLLIGVIDEFVQGQTPGRVADPWDIAVDLFGLLVGIWFANVLRSVLCCVPDQGGTGVGQPIATARIFPTDSNGA